jgi:ribosomal-protein-alanine N-acetyltransferase
LIAAVIDDALHPAEDDPLRSFRFRGEFETIWLSNCGNAVSTMDFTGQPIHDSLLRIETPRLILEPITACHASEMALLLGDARLYKFLPSDPPDVAVLAKLYEMWEARCSPDGNELWLNWVGRRRETKDVVGHFQAGVESDSSASIAYTVGVEHQRQGFATEAMTAVCEFLVHSLEVHTIRAWIDTRNEASIHLVQRLGLHKAQFIEDADVFKGSSSHEYVFERTIGKSSVDVDER